MRQTLTASLLRCFLKCCWKPQQTLLVQSPLLRLCQIFPNPSNFDPVSLSHVYLYGHNNPSQNKQHLGKASVRLESWRKSVTLRSLHRLSVFNGGDTETNE